MIKRTLYFGNPAYLSLRNSQMVISMPSKESSDNTEQRTIPIEDVAYIILDCPQITITHGLISALLDYNVAIIHCDDKHMPVGLMLPLSGNTLQGERFRNQIEASSHLKNHLWKQTIQTKITNQMVLLQSLAINTGNMERWANDVKIGDAGNNEARAAAYYWKVLFGKGTFTRDRYGVYPNNLLNYGYAILRAVIARSLVAAGLLPTLGIHHHNRYNAYCLADDVMEPYRPFVDKIVKEIYNENIFTEKITIDIKRYLLTLPVVDVMIDGHRSPLMVAASITATSLYKCYTGEGLIIKYPSIIL